MTGLYDYDTRLDALNCQINTANLSARNKELILKYQQDCILRGLSKPRIIKNKEIRPMLLYFFKTKNP